MLNFEFKFELKITSISTFSQRIFLSIIRTGSSYTGDLLVLCSLILVYHRSAQISSTHTNLFIVHAVFRHFMKSKHFCLALS